MLPAHLLEPLVEAGSKVFESLVAEMVLNVLHSSGSRLAYSIVTRSCKSISYRSLAYASNGVYDIFQASSHDAGNVGDDLGSLHSLGVCWTLESGRSRARVRASESEIDFRIAIPKSAVDPAFFGCSPKDQVWRCFC